MNTACSSLGDRLGESIAQAAAAIANADALLVAAGAGMGVDSGLPDFRGNEGFWRAYPPFRRLGLDFVSLANPHWFERDPTLAWGFYGHRRNLYRRTSPHAGFDILREWAGRMPLGGFVFTSNVDHHFQKSGWDEQRIYEVHGSVEWLQCRQSCGIGVFPASEIEVDVDPQTMRAREPLPSCPACGKLARPNILMFGDFEWDSRRAEEQESRLFRWLESVDRRKLVIIECGAGMAVPTVRRFSERVAADYNAVLFRINPREPEVPHGHIGMSIGALDALRQISLRE